MIDEDERVKLTPAEIGLLREVIRWRRANDVSFYLSCAGRNFSGPSGFLEWSKREGQMKWSVALDRSTPNLIGEVHDYFGMSYEYHRVDTVTEAVDILAALGYLPPRFSSAYRAGWNAGRSDMEHPVPAGPEFAAILPAAWRIA